jgi:hypothetical protein
MKGISKKRRFHAVLIVVCGLLELFSQECRGMDIQRIQILKREYVAREGCWYSDNDPLTVKAMYDDLRTKNQEDLIRTVVQLTEGSYLYTGGAVTGLALCMLTPQHQKHFSLHQAQVGDGVFNVDLSTVHNQDMINTLAGSIAAVELNGSLVANIPFIKFFPYAEDDRGGIINIDLILRPNIIRQLRPKAVGLYKADTNTLELTNRVRLALLVTNKESPGKVLFTANYPMRDVPPGQSYKLNVGTKRHRCRLSRSQLRHMRTTRHLFRQVIVRH